MQDILCQTGMGGHVLKLSEKEKYELLQILELMTDKMIKARGEPPKSKV